MLDVDAVIGNKSIISLEPKEKPKLWAHQETAKKLALQTDGFGLFMSLGTGKTATTIHILSEIYRRHKLILPTLILCPPIVIKNWQREFRIHSDIPHDKVIPLVGSGKDRLKKYMTSGRHGIYITNYESLTIKPLLEAILRHNPDVLVLDELHKVKDIKAKRTKACIQLADKAIYRYGLTGTPVLNSPMDLYSQFRILDLGKTFGKSFFVFRSTYFYDGNSGMPSLKHFPNWKVRPGALETINAAIKKRSFVVTKEECLSLPPLIRKEFEVELSSEQRRHYDSMRKDLITYVKGEACLAKIALTKSLRLLQIVSGFITLEGENGAARKDVPLDNPRIEALRKLLEDIGATSKTIIWATFKANYAAIMALCDDMGISYKTLTGDDSAKDKDLALEDFKDPNGARIMIANPGAGGVGVDGMQIASYSIYYSRGFSLEHDIQSESRNHRAGSEIHQKITRIDLITPGTIDEFVAKRLFQKQALSDTILLDYLRKGL